MSSTFQLLKQLSAAFCYVCLFSSTATAEESSKRLVPGKIVVAGVTGEVKAVEPESGSARPLKLNDLVTEKSTVNVGRASSAILAFWNGSTVNLSEDSSLIISQFLQDPFGVQVSQTVLTEEPSTSVTKLDLVNGEVVCNVKKLRMDRGSSLVVNTPVGAAGVRGTIFAVSYVQDPGGGGKWIHTLSVTEGSVSFTDQNGNLTMINAGQEVVVTVRVAIDAITGNPTITEVLEFEVRDIPMERQEVINQEATKGDEASMEVYVGLMDFSYRDGLKKAIDSVPPIVNPPQITNPNP